MPNIREVLAQGPGFTPNKTKVPFVQVSTNQQSFFYNAKDYDEEKKQVFIAINFPMVRGNIFYTSLNAQDT
ncbi:MAG: hypothetical protein SD837_09725 [Candidatus Electrothrix scaldis]|nr:MAG: hypothetical protein SD837_09725 [Candidatus Electrothrix sp. GW3-3]